MKKLFLILGLIIFLSPRTEAQPPGSTNLRQLQSYQDTLKELGFKIVNDSIEPARYNAGFRFIRTLVNALKVPYSFNFPFDSLKTVSVQTSPDKHFRIFSWNIMNSDGSYRYYGTVQMNTPDGKLTMFPLVDHSSEFENPADSITTSDKWYGARYYRVISVINNVKDPYYILLGWKGNTVRSTKKVIEVLHFKDGQAFFGMPVFDGDKDHPAQKRVIFEYSRRASMLLNYDPKISTIVFDHLAPPDENLKGRFELYGPDFSYDGYKLNNGRWKLAEDLQLKNPPTDQDDNFNDPKKL